MQYRKKPVVIEAVRWSGDLADLATVQALSSHKPDEDVKIGPCPAAEGETLHDLWIDTLEGTMKAKPGDYVIRGVKGEVYPCKPDIFAATYEIVTDC